MITLKEEHKRDACYFGEIPDWLIAYSRNRDSDLLTQSNWKAFLEALGGESDTVGITRSSHWAVGWVEYLVIDPTDTEKVKIAEKLQERLEDYPCLDEETFSKLEWKDYQESWQAYGRSDFVRGLKKEFGLSDTTFYFLYEIGSEALQSFFESLIPSGEYFTAESSGVSIQTSYAVEKCQREDLAVFLRTQRYQSKL